MIEVEGLRKEYGDFAAVEDCSFSVTGGDAVGLVGPNGAGKTTTLKMLAGLLAPSDGTASIAGTDVSDADLHYDIGFLPEENPVYDRMTAREYLLFFADLYDVPRETARDRISRVLDRLDLEHRDRRLGNMSKGMTRKTLIARSLVNDPDVLIYDEPASGLDPVTTEEILAFVKELRDDGKTIVFSAHNLHHVEEVCDQVVILNEGRVLTRGTLDEIRAEYSDTQYRVIATEAVDGTTETDSGLHRITVGDLDAVDDVRANVREAGGEVVNVQTEGGSLEDIFLRLTSPESN